MGIDIGARLARLRTTLASRQAEAVAARRRLLPEEAYGGMYEGMKDHVDARLRAHLHQIPTVPGAYLDGQGHRYTLDADGAWTDRKGQTRTAEWAPHMAAFIIESGPLVPLTDDGVLVLYGHVEVTGGGGYVDDLLGSEPVPERDRARALLTAALPLSEADEARVRRLVDVLGPDLTLHDESQVYAAEPVEHPGDDRLWHYALEAVVRTASYPDERVNLRALVDLDKKGA